MPISRQPLQHQSSTIAARHEASEFAACGVGFVVARSKAVIPSVLQKGLDALTLLEHRGAVAADGRSSDGAGVMTAIPWEVLGGESDGRFGVVTLFLPTNEEKQRLCIGLFEEGFAAHALRINRYREVPVNRDTLGTTARESCPRILQGFVELPHVSSVQADHLLFKARQRVRALQHDHRLEDTMFFVSCSSTTIVYKALTSGDDLPSFYDDLRDTRYQTPFVMLHRRFSTNTRTSWDKAQPFRCVAHNGEINTIAGNRRAAIAREAALKVRPGSLVTHHSISDSGSLNEMVEALSMSGGDAADLDVLSMVIPAAGDPRAFVEPWDGPALVTFCDGRTMAAKMDRNGFRPSRWQLSEDFFVLASEEGAFPLDEETVVQRGSLSAGGSVAVALSDGTVTFYQALLPKETIPARSTCEQVVSPLSLLPPTPPCDIERALLFGVSKEEVGLVIEPMIESGKEPIGSMGDTAALAVLSSQDRPLFDFFSQRFAQVTNPPFDYLRESMIADLAVPLGAMAHGFVAPDEVEEQKQRWLKSPILLDDEFRLVWSNDELLAGTTTILPSTVALAQNESLTAALDRLATAALHAVEQGSEIVVLSDRTATVDAPPIPSLLTLRAVKSALESHGRAFDASVIIDSGDVRSTHHLAVLVAYGATAVCPWYLCGMAEQMREKATDATTDFFVLLREALEHGFLKVMSKMGISVARSYVGSHLFTPIGIGVDLLGKFFSGKPSLIGGVGIEFFEQQILTRVTRAKSPPPSLPNMFFYKDHPKGSEGERHAMGISLARAFHLWLKTPPASDEEATAYQQLIEVRQKALPISIRHLLEVTPRPSDAPPPVAEEVTCIVRRFGAGAMSFGSISADSQRDIIIAMKRLGGRSNSGEGGENPWYFTHGISATIKQVASGRFGVTAEYLCSGEEVQIKMAQGAKPGEGGQIMGVKVTPEIARARNALPGTTLISPPPQHDIYSIEDLKELIYEIKQLVPHTPVSVKLVAGEDIGTIAVGVAKAGADVIHVSGLDGGTGAASLSSMKHAGLPWELGINEVHRALGRHGLRSRVRLRVDGGLQRGLDVIVARILGADEFDFGKLLLVALGCIMARVCEKNTCPTGIATQDPKFLKKYQGTPERVVRTLLLIAEEVRTALTQLGVGTLDELVDRRDLLQPSPHTAALCSERAITLSLLLEDELVCEFDSAHRGDGQMSMWSPLNERIVEESRIAWEDHGPVLLDYPICSTDRAIPAALCGVIASRRCAFRRDGGDGGGGKPDATNIRLTLHGTAGQGFGAFLVEGVSVTLTGAANDSVAKSMSGGTITILPSPHSRVDAATASLIGNTALYGATGGRLFVYGKAGDRFAVRNSGANAIVEGVGMHPCEYMTGGLVIILGSIGGNAGAGMTGGHLVVPSALSAMINQSYVAPIAWDEVQRDIVDCLLAEYCEQTKSYSASKLRDEWKQDERSLLLCAPRAVP